MISHGRVRVLARQNGVTAGMAEKHYVNSWVMYAMTSSPLGESLEFRGGTALSKLYFRLKTERQRRNHQSISVTASSVIASASPGSNAATRYA
jgi:predicted nucleotidyltransferase component of viral defense system